MTTPAELARRIDVALGRAPADLAVVGGRVLDTATGTVRAADVAIVGDTIVAVGEPRRALRTLDARGRFVVPGFVDAHVHVESSLVTPESFERAVLPRGTTTAVWDPHEIANVLGLAGIRYALDAARALVMRLEVMLSSCVPATDLETAGAVLDAADLAALADAPGVRGLAELMSFPAVLAKGPGVLAKLAAFAGRHVDGHAPLLSGAALDAYLATGIRTDHECTRLAEAREKLEKGMTILLREGSVAKNVAALAPLITDATWMRTAFCTDDRNPLEIAHEGHIDHAIRVAIRAGAPVIACYRAATLGAALAFGLADRGIVAAGRRADLALVDDLAAVTVADVVCGGRVVEPALFESRCHPAPPGRGSVRRPPVGAADLAVPARDGPTPVIRVVPGSLITEREAAVLPVAGGRRTADPAREILKAAVLERHGRNGNIGLGFVTGFGPLRGAIGSSVGHDSHNLTVVGADDADMVAAVARLMALGGGVVVVQGGVVLAELALPIAGLMSDRPLPAVSAALVSLRAAARAIGCTLDEPLLQLAFLPLPVIPHLKLTDRGLVAAGPTGVELVPL
jgi:adenine deaminase